MSPSTARPPSAQVLRQFRIVFNAVRTHFQQVEKASGVGAAQVWALSVIRDEPGIGVTGLARRLDIHQSTASNLVKLLVERGLIEALREAADKRAVQLKLRPAGRQVLRKAPGPFTGLLPQALASLDAATLTRLDADLGKVIGALQADQSGARKLLAEM